MKNNIMMVLGVTALLILARSATAEGPVGVSVGASTLGAGVSVDWPVNDEFSLRAQGNSFKYGADFNKDEIKYDADLKLSSYGLLADWYVFDDSGFRVTFGAFYNGNKITGTGSPRSGTDFVVDGTAYTLDTLDAEIKFDNFAPYVGMGWASNPVSEEGFGISADLGVLYQGSPSVEFKASGTGISVPGFEDSLSAESKRVEDKLNSFQWYPVVGLSVFYRF